MKTAAQDLDPSVANQAPQARKEFPLVRLGMLENDPREVQVEAQPGRRCLEAAPRRRVAWVANPCPGLRVAGLRGELPSRVTDGGLLPDLPGLLAAMLFLIGGGVFALYPVAVSHAADRAPAGALVRMSQGLLLINALGATLSPPLITPLMIHTGNAGLFVALAGLGVVLVRSKCA